MTWIDVAVIATTCLSAAFGFWRGLLRPLIGVAGLLGGLLLAAALYRQLAYALWQSHGAWPLVAAYAIILLGVLVATVLLSILVGRLVHMTPLGIIDRLLGLTVVTLVALIAWALVLTILMIVLPGSDGLLADSFVAQFLIRSLTAIPSLPPPESLTPGPV